MTPLPGPDVALHDSQPKPAGDGVTPSAWRGDATAPTYTVHRGWLLGPDRERLLNLRPELWVALRSPSGRWSSPRPRVHRRRFGPLRVRVNDRTGWQLEAHLRAGPARYALRLTALANDPRITLELTASYDREVQVGLEVLSLVSARPAPRGRVIALDRAYRWRRVRRAAFSGALTPRMVEFERPGARVTLVGQAGVQGLHVIPLPGGRHQIGLELDHLRNHPFHVITRCTARRQLAPARRRLSEGRRCRSSSRVMRATLLLGRADVPLVRRYPEGRRAALVLSDHADQSSAAKLEAFAFGQTGALDQPRQPHSPRGFVGHGLTYTKTIFIRRRGPYQRQLEDPRYRAVLDAMARRGVEVGLHSPTGRADPPAAVQSALSTFRALYPGQTWIDHQPDTNCEAVTSRGWDPDGRWYVLPLLRAAGVKYLWAGHDVKLPPDSLNMLRPGQPGLRSPVAYRHTRLEPCEASGAGSPPVLFSTVMLFEGRRRLLRRITPQRLDRLEAEHGLLIAHTYLDSHRPRGRFRDRSLLRALGGGRYALRREVDDLFAGLGRRQAEKTLWVSTVGQVLDHLLAAMQTTIELAPDGAAQIRTPRPLAGLTLRVPAPRGATALIDGAPPPGLRRAGDALELWFNTRGDRAHRLELRDARGELAPLWRAARVELR